MSQWIALSHRQHADHFSLPRDNYHFATSFPVAKVLLAELTRLLPHYVLGFIAQAQGYQAVALLSLDGQTNLYIGPDGKWLGGYVPAALRGYPFTLASTEDGQKALCLDQAHLSSDQGQPLFDDVGQLATSVQQTLEFLKQCEQNRQTTQKAVDVLTEAGVIEPWPLRVERGEGQEPLKVGGLHRINETALNALESNAYARLRGGPMALAHAQLFSANQVHHLTERARFQARQAAGEPPENLDALFGEEDDFTFDFDT